MKLKHGADNGNLTLGYQFESGDDEHEPRSVRYPDKVFSECWWGVNERYLEEFEFEEE